MNAFCYFFPCFRDFLCHNVMGMWSLAKLSYLNRTERLSLHLLQLVTCAVLKPIMAVQPLVGHSLLIVEVSKSHSDTPHPVGLVWTSGRPVSETCTWQHTTLTRDKHPCPQRDSYPHTNALDNAAIGIGMCGCYYSYFVVFCTAEVISRHQFARRITETA
jgi:hypothetical protein